jgi:hypothetical protein
MTMAPDAKRLLALLRTLDEADRATLLAFAEFLGSRGREQPQQPQLPEPLPRPQKETVVGALRRLSATYPMLNKAKLLNETSILMSQHVMQGRNAVEVIEELEVLFRRHYEEHVGNDDRSA